MSITEFGGKDSSLWQGHIWSPDTGTRLLLSSSLLVKALCDFCCCALV